MAVLDKKDEIRGELPHAEANLQEENANKHEEVSAENAELMSKNEKFAD